MKERTPENIALANRVKARRKGSDAGSDIKLEVTTVGAPIVKPAGPRQQQVKKTRSRRTGK